ncbi:MAG: class I SAM-dependent methyltransferase [Chloroflexia bacterium]|nr:class I SAM-dependent methyltransferase [Chloroflexia bacterium]
MESWLHKKVAGDVVKTSNKSTLEIGAGTLNHLKYEQPTTYDIIEPFAELYQNSKHLKRINTIYSDIDEIDLSKEYDRITSIATFEHILDLPKVVAKTCLLLKKDGALRIAIPNEGTFLWKLGWKLTTGIEFKLKYRLDYGLLMKYEHVNTAMEIETILKHFYNKVNSASFGIHKKIALYRFFECKNANIDHARKFLNF